MKKSTKKTVAWIVVTLVGVVIYRQWVKGKSGPVLAQSLPTGAKLTGKTLTTTNGGAPGQTEIVGYAVRNWAEFVTPTGQTDWVEIRR